MVGSVTASHPGILNTCSSSTVPRQIIVGNGGLMSASSTGHASIPTSSNPLVFTNVLIAPQLVKNLISVCALTRDNSVSVEFDPWGFSIKDLRTRMVLLRCDSSGELYPCAPWLRRCSFTTLLGAPHIVRWSPLSLLAWPPRSRCSSTFVSHNRLQLFKVQSSHVPCLLPWQARAASIQRVLKCFFVFFSIVAL